MINIPASCVQLLLVNQDGAKALEQDIEDAKAAAVKASRETYKPPEHLPLHDHDIKSDEM